MRARVCAVELRVAEQVGVGGSRLGSPVPEARTENTALRGELARLEGGLAQAMRQISEMQAQIRALQQQVGAAPCDPNTGPLAGPDGSHASQPSPADGGSAIGSHVMPPMQLLTPPHPRAGTPAPGAAPVIGVGSMITVPSPEPIVGEVGDKSRHVWAVAPKGATEHLDGFSTPTQNLTPSCPRLLSVQPLATAGASLGQQRACFSPPQTARLQSGHMSARMATTQPPLGTASRFGTPVQLSGGRAAAQERGRAGTPHSYQPAPRSAGTPPMGVHVCHTPVRNGACHRLAAHGPGTPVYRPAP